MFLTFVKIFVQPNNTLTKALHVTIVKDLFKGRAKAMEELDDNGFKETDEAPRPYEQKGDVGFARFTPYQMFLYVVFTC